MKNSNEKKHISTLDSIRGIAALSVVLYHLPPWHSAFYDIPFVRHGDLMVDFFFVLSGFVMTLNYGHRISSGIEFRKFALLRLVRLYPTHLVFALLFLGVEFFKFLAVQRGYASPNTIPFEHNSIAVFFQHLFLVQALGFTPDASTTFNGPSWSISTEYYTYLTFAAAVLLSGKYFRIISLIAAAILCAGLATLPTELVNFQPLLRCLYGFFVGCATCYLYKTKLRPSVTLVFTSAAMIILYLVLFKPVPLLMVPLTALLIWSVAHNPISWLNLSPIHKLGMISYSLYMSHALVLWIANQGLRFVLKAPEKMHPFGSYPTLDFKQALIVYPLTIFACIMVGTLTYRWIEQPSLKWVQKLKLSFEGARPKHLTENRQPLPEPVLKI